MEYGGDARLHCLLAHLERDRLGEVGVLAQHVANGGRCSRVGADAKNLPESPAGLDLAVCPWPGIVKFVRAMTMAPLRRGPFDFTVPTVVMAGSAPRLDGGSSWRRSRWLSDRRLTSG